LCFINPRKSDYFIQSDAAIPNRKGGFSLVKGMEKYHREYLRRQFDGSVYVYAYVDPWTDEPFFIGQASGDYADKNLRRRGTPFHSRVEDIQSYGLNPLVIRLLTGLNRREATAAVRFFVLALGCQGSVDSPGPLLNREAGVVGVRPRKGVYKIDRGGRDVWVASFYQTWIGQAATYEEALAIRLAEEARSRGMSRRAWEKNWAERRSAGRVSR
jgi:hypothetical protein